MPIFDQGYQHWQGELAGHGARWLAVARHGVRTQLQNRFVRLLMFVAWLPALALVAFLTLWGLLEQQAESVITILQRLLPPEIMAQPRDYRAAVWTIAYTYFFKIELFCSLVLVMVVGPNLISRDLRFNALPLYLSRPVRRIDYFFGKLGVIGFFLAATLVVPAIGAYLLGLAFSLDLGVIRDTHRLLWAGIVYGLVITVASGTLMLALSSLSRRSIYVGIAWAGIIFLSHTLSSVLVGINDGTEYQQIVRGGIEQWVKDHPPPPGIAMRGPYPQVRYNPSRAKEKDKDGQPVEQSREERVRERWLRQWDEEQTALRAKAEAARAARSYSDWRPTLSFANNLDRIGDGLLGADTAWELVGATFERPRQMMEVAKGRPVPASTAPPNTRRLAEQRVWQFPWYWSAGVLASVCLLSALVLSRRVKSLDRLK